jgi:hypothetical protein
MGYPPDPVGQKTIIGAKMGPGLRPDRLLSYLILASLIYLALPYIIFFSGWLKALIEFQRHFDGIYTAGKLVQTPQISQVRSIDEWGLATEKDVSILLQYVGNPQTPFFKLLAKEP